MIKKAMVFAAGKGTRLKPLTDHKPKALVEVGGVPMLGRVIEKLKDIGIREVVVNVHHFANQIKDYIAANDQFGIDIHISDESELLLDTGGGIIKAARWLETGDEPFIVHNADILTDFDIASMIEDHKANERDVTLLCDRRETSRYLLFDKKMKMHGWMNVSTGKVRPSTLDVSLFNKYAFGGVHILRPSVIEALRLYSNECAAITGSAKDKTVFSIMDFFVEYCSRLNIGGYRPEHPYMWHDIGKPEALVRANEQFLANRTNSGLKKLLEGLQTSHKRHIFC